MLPSLLACFSSNISRKLFNKRVIWAAGNNPPNPDVDTEEEEEEEEEEDDEDDDDEADEEEEEDDDEADEADEEEDDEDEEVDEADEEEEAGFTHWASSGEHTCTPWPKLPVTAFSTLSMPVSTSAKSLG